MSEEITKDCENYHKGWCLLSKTSYGNVTEFCSEKNNCSYKQLKRLEQELKEKDNFLKWLITQQYYIIPKNLKQKIKEILKDV